MTKKSQRKTVISFYLSGVVILSFFLQSLRKLMKQAIKLQQYVTVILVVSWDSKFIYLTTY